MTVDSNEAEVLDEWRRKRALRRQRNRSEEDRPLGSSRSTSTNDANDNDDNDDDDRAVALTAAKRRKLELEAFLQSRGGNRNNKNTNTNTNSSSKKTKIPQPNNNTEKFTKESTEKDPSNLHPKEPTANSTSETSGTAVESLMNQAQELQTLTAAERAAQQRQHEEEMLLKQAQAQFGKNALQSAKDVATGIVYTKPMPSTWRIPRHYLRPPPPHQTPEAWWQTLRQQFYINAEGKDIPPPLTRFIDMRLPPPILDCLKEKQIAKPTPIQMQGIPVALAGRDMVGIAFTGSGKTLAFTLPAVMVALEQELLMPLQPGEGPVALLMAPSRELARQTHEILQEFCQAITQQSSKGYPTELNSLLVVGGEPMGVQVRTLREKPTHCIVCTAGRVRMLLKENRMNFDNCRLIALDEADRLLDLGFDEDVGDIFNYFHHQKQVLLFSATFPQKFQDFCRQTLVQPVVVNVGRAGAANLDVIQEVEYVKQEAKLVYLLSALQKTAPPVCIFSQRQKDVDDIHEYLLLKGVQAVSIHGGKDQQDRNMAIDLFKKGDKDVLIATDVAAKGTYITHQ